MALRKLFAGADLHIEDLYLLDPFQVEYLPGWLPERELALVLWAHPPIDRFLRAKCPAVSGFLDAAKASHPPSPDRSEIAKAADAVVWTIADLIVYNKCPELYDRLEFHNWDFTEVTSIAPLDRKVVVDVGAGTGRVALEAAETADRVYAVEPVARLRRFIREKAARHGLTNVHVLDGFCHDISLPNGIADVVMTSHALGWRLEDELAEFERVAMPGGYVVHCPGTAETPGNSSETQHHERLVSPHWGYRHARYRESDGWKRKYWKRLPPQVSSGSQLTPS